MLLSFGAVRRGGVRSCAFCVVSVVLSLALPGRLATAGAVPPDVAIGGAPVTAIAAAKYYSFQPWATDTQHKPLKFSINNKPAWAGFDPSTGRLYGTPVPANMGTYRNVVITVTDGSAQANLAPFSVTVTGLNNHAPALSGVPPTTVRVGQPYAFQVAGHDADGDRISYELYAGPAWLKMDVATGKLSGIPTAADVGTYTNFYVSATDGYARGYLQQFSITVLPALASSITVPVYSAVRLDWLPPTENTDSSALLDLAGYRVYYGGAPDSLVNRIDLPTSGVASFVVGGLSAGTWYFAVTAYNAAGLESDPSNVATSIIAPQ